MASSRLSKAVLESHALTGFAATVQLSLFCLQTENASDVENDCISFEYAICYAICYAMLYARLYARLSKAGVVRHYIDVQLGIPNPPSGIVG